MSEHPNVARLRAGAEAYNSGDPDALMATWTAEPVFHHCGAGPLAGTYRGREEFLAYVKKSYELSDKTMKLEGVDYLADDGHGVAIFDSTTTRGDKTCNVSLAYAATFDSDGKQKEGWFLVNDQVGWDEFWK
jgi:uncharacterized protein